VSGLRTVQRVDEVRSIVAGWKRAGARVGFVPTMGNLHAGHFALVDQARASCDRVVASVFVNPTQFGPNEDFARYPRTLERDQAGLDAHGCELLFAPTVPDMYPRGTQDLVSIRVPGLEEILCGAFRPGHFAGVATVVARLFGIVQPDVAVFGRKDFQQLAVVRRMVDDLALPVRVDAGDTVREPDGLALSSRNQYLDAAERALAPALYRTLQEAAAAWRAGQSVDDAETAARAALERLGFRPDYVALRAVAALDRSPETWDEPAVALAAAWLGRTRLIDNLLIG
jgi:pantoate--beta-alanine ligase